MFWLSTLLWASWLMGQAFRDATWITGLCFYIPSPFLGVVLAAVAAYAWRKERQGVAALFLLLALPPAVFVLAVENHYGERSRQAIDGATSRLVHWNIAYGKLGTRRIESVLVDEDADIYIVSEVPVEIDAEGFALRLGESYDQRSLSQHGGRGPWLSGTRGLALRGGAAQRVFRLLEVGGLRAQGIRGRYGLERAGSS